MNCFQVFTRRCRHWGPLKWMTGCLVALVTYVLYANDEVIVAAVASVFQHSVIHDNVGEQLTTSKNKRVIYVQRA